MTAMIDVRGASKAYAGGAETALRSVDLAIDHGEFVAVMGPSGSGKSTLLNLIAGLDRPTDGTVRVNNLDLGTLDEGDLSRFRRAHVGFVFQFFHLLDSMTVRENVSIPAQLQGIKRTEVRRRVSALLDRVGLASKADEYPGRLSGGQRQRTAIARALINDPPLLLADEPTGALDSRTGEEIMGLLRELNDEGHTILLVTHDARLAATHARRIVTLRDGRVVDDAVLSPSPRTTGPDLLPFRIEGVC